MKTLILVCIAALVGCTNYPNFPLINEESTGGSFISREQAIQIAKDANIMEYDRSQSIEAELMDDQYIVTFPVNKRTEPGTSYLGPDYAAQYWIDAKTGEVLRVKLGG